MGGEEDKQNQEKNLEMLHKWRGFFDEIRINLSNSFDKYLLTFATGTLYLSVYFTSGLAPLSHGAILGWGWGVLLTSIFATLLSIALSIMAYDREIAITDKKIEVVQENKVVIGADNVWNKFVTFGRWVSIITFIVGIVLLSYFYFVNLPFNA